MGEDERAFFMRVRGRVLGPFDQQKLQGLSRRGQLSRMHEVSTDGVTWVRAETFPELFSVGIVETRALDNLAATFVPAATGDGAQAYAPAAASPAGKQDWYYTSGGQEQGPVDFSSLQLLAGSGQLGPQDLVWTRTMGAWTPATQIAGLTRTDGARPAADSRYSAQEQAAGELPPGLRVAAQSSKPWVMFLAIAGFVLAALGVVGGMVFLVFGAKMGPAGGGVIFAGLIQFIQAAVVAAGAMLLLSYANQLGILANSKLPVALEKALNTLRNFWVFVSIVLIVQIAFVAFFVILVFSAVISFPHL